MLFLRRAKERVSRRRENERSARRPYGVYATNRGSVSREEFPETGMRETLARVMKPSRSRRILSLGSDYCGELFPCDDYEYLADRHVAISFKRATYWVHFTRSRSSGCGGHGTEFSWSIV